jgi:hypothetical protein
MNSALEPQKGLFLQTPCFEPFKTRLELLSRTVSDKCYFSSMFVVICYSSHRKWIWHSSSQNGYHKIPHTHIPKLHIPFSSTISTTSVTLVEQATIQTPGVITIGHGISSGRRPGRSYLSHCQPPSGPYKDLPRKSWENILAPETQLSSRERNCQILWVSVIAKWVSKPPGQ